MGCLFLFNFLSFSLVSGLSSVGVWRSAWAPVGGALYSQDPLWSWLLTWLESSHHCELIKAGSSLQSVPVCQLPTGKSHCASALQFLTLLSS